MGEVRPNVTLRHSPLNHRELCSRPLSASRCPNPASVELLRNGAKTQAALLVSLDMREDRPSKRIGLFLVSCCAFLSCLNQSPPTWIAELHAAPFQRG